MDPTNPVSVHTAVIPDGIHECKVYRNNRWVIEKIQLHNAYIQVPVVQEFFICYHVIPKGYDLDGFIEEDLIVKFSHRVHAKYVINGDTCHCVPAAYYI